MSAAARERAALAAYRALLDRQSAEREGAAVPPGVLAPDHAPSDRRLRERAWRTEMERRARDLPQARELWEELVAARRARAATYEELRRAQPDPAILAAHEASELRGAIEEFITSVLVRLHERQRRRWNLRTVRPWDLPPVSLQSWPAPESEGPMVSSAPAGEAAARARDLEGILLRWTFAAMSDALERRLYADGLSLDAAAGEWARLWLLFLPGVDWSGLEPYFPADLQRRTALILSPCEALPRAAGELQSYWWRVRGAEEAGGSAALLDPAAVHDVARHIEDEIEALETLTAPQL